MPIRFDRYAIPQASFPGAPGARLPGPDTTAADAFGLISKTAQAAVGPLAKARRAQQDLAEKVRVGERYLSAAEEMDRKLIEIEQRPELREKAEERWAEWIAQRHQQWARGLSPEGALALRDKLAEKQYSGSHRARVIEVKDLEARANTVILGHAKAYVDAFVRAGDDLVETEIGEDGQARVREPREFQDLQEAYGHAVASGAKTYDVAAKELLSHKQEAAAAKAHGMILSGVPGDLRRLRDLIAQEEEKPGTTFLGILDPARRNAIKKQARDETFTQLQRQEAQADRARQRLKDGMAAQSEDWARRTDTMLRDGTLSEAWIEDGKKFDLVNDVKAAFYRTALEKRRTGEAGPNDEFVFRRLAPQIYSESSDPRALLADVQAAFAAGRLNYPTAITSWSSHLESRIERDKMRGDSPEERALKDERGDIEKLIKILTTTRGIFEKLDPVANRLHYQLLRELGTLPSAESAKVWWDRREVRAFSQMRGIALQYIRTERDAMHLAVEIVPPDGTNAADVIAARKKEYVRKFGGDWKAKMLDDVDRLQKMQSLQAEMDAKRPDGAGVPGPKPAPSSQKPAPPAAKPRGPLKPGSRS